VSQKKFTLPSEVYWNLSQQLRIFNPNFTHLLHVHIYTKLCNFIQLSLTLAKLCYITCDHWMNFYIPLQFSTFNLLFLPFVFVCSWAVLELVQIWLVLCVHSGSCQLQPCVTRRLLHGACSSAVHLIAVLSNFDLLCSTVNFFCQSCLRKIGNPHWQ